MRKMATHPELFLTKNKRLYFELIDKLVGAEVTVLSERRILPPYGLFGGNPGKVGNNLIYRDSQKQQMPGKFSEQLNKGDIIRIETPGGGGYGTTPPTEKK